MTPRIAFGSNMLIGSKDSSNPLNLLPTQKEKPEARKPPVRPYQSRHFSAKDGGRGVPDTDIAAPGLCYIDALLLISRPDNRQKKLTLLSLGHEGWMLYGGSRT